MLPNVIAVGSSLLRSNHNILCSLFCSSFASTSLRPRQKLAQCLGYTRDTLFVLQSLPLHFLQQYAHLCLCLSHFSLASLYLVTLPSAQLTHNHRSPQKLTAAPSLVSAAWFRCGTSLPLHAAWSAPQPHLPRASVSRAPTGAHWPFHPQAAFRVFATWPSSYEPNVCRTHKPSLGIHRASRPPRLRNATIHPSLVVSNRPSITSVLTETQHTPRAPRVVF